MADVTINGDNGGLKLSWPRVVAVVIFLVVFGVSVGRILANQEAQQKQLDGLTAVVAAQTEQINRLAIAVEVLKVPPKVDGQNRITR